MVYVMTALANTHTSQPCFFPQSLLHICSSVFYVPSEASEYSRKQSLFTGSNAGATEQGSAIQDSLNILGLFLSYQCMSWSKFSQNSPPLQSILSKMIEGLYGKWGN